EGCAAGVSAAGAARVFLKNCGLKKNSGYGAELSGAAFLSAEACVFAGNAAGLFAGDSASLRLKNCLFEGQPGPAAAFCGRARAELAGCASSGAGAGFLFSDGCAGKVAGCAFAHGAAPALTVRGRAVVSVSDSACAGGPSALLLDGGSASLLKVKISGTPFPGIVCGDWRRLAAAEVTYEGRPWLKPAAAGAPARPGRLFLFAAATARLPGFSALYRLFYLAAVPAARRLLDVPGVRALYLYRGMAAKGWVAGLSDMDLACVLRPAAPRGEYEVYCALRRRLRLLKRLFPFTGEVLLAQAPEFAAFLGSWGVKGAEFSAASRLLYGAAVELKPAPAAAGTADLTEAFYAYTLLTRHFLAADLPEAFGRRNCLKNLVDIKRYLAPPAPERASRRAYARLLGLPLEDFMAVSRGEAAYGAFQALHQAAAGADGQILLEPGPEAAAGWFNRPAFDAACRGLAEECGVRPGVVLDSLYRVYLVLPDAAAGDRALFLRACAALGRLRAASPALGASPLVLTRSAFALLCRLPYLNNPAFSLDLRAGGLPGGYRPDDGGVYCYNLVCGGAAPQAAELRAAAVLAARHFCAAWRSLWAEMPPHYFYTRALGLRLLLEKNTALPFSEPERLRAAFPPGGEMPPWSAYCAGGACEANYCFVAAQTAKLGELADAL
ncbi:MAG: right-handed parallel beta-helix repeat-containing protein, partial [Elusimicrobia bacterium]|nr:right-handed parallel beta-helix repeat-containing protein [Elusimicrobiota bacterium]